MSRWTAPHQTDLSWVTAGEEQNPPNLGPLTHTHEHVLKNVRRTQQVLAINPLTHGIKLIHFINSYMQSY